MEKGKENMPAFLVKPTPATFFTLTFHGKSLL